MANTLVIHEADRDDGPLPSSHRPGLFQHGFPNFQQDYADFLTLPNIALIRVHLDWYYGRDKHEYLQNLQAAFDANDYFWVQPLRAGVRMMLDTRYMPKWLRRANRSDQGIANTYPSELDIWEEVCFQVGSLFMENGIDPDLCYFSATNEPTQPDPSTNQDDNPNDAQTTFYGTLRELVVYLAHTWHGYKRADQRFRTGGAQFGHPHDPVDQMVEHAGNTGWAIEEFIRECAYPPRWLYGGARLPLNFLSFHRFNTRPNTTLARVHRYWLEKYGYDFDRVDIIVDESNYGIGSQMTPERCGVYGAVHTVLRFINAGEEGASHSCYALMREGNINDTAKGYDGQSGLVHRVNGGTYNLQWVGVAGLHTMWALSRLGKRKIVQELSADADATGITVVSTSEGSTRWVLIIRGGGFTVSTPGVPGDIASEFARRFAKLGYRPIRASGSTGGGQALNYSHEIGEDFDSNLFGDYVHGTLSLRAGLPAQLVADMEATKATCIAQEASWAGPVDLTYTVADPGVVTTVTEYGIGVTGIGVTNDPYAAFVAQQAIGSFDSAVEAAIANAGQAMQATFTGTGSAFPRTVSLPPFCFLLVKIEGTGTPNPNTDGWTPKPVAPWLQGGLVQLNADYNSQDFEMQPVLADGNLVSDALVIYNRRTPIDRVVDAIQRIKDRVAIGGSDLRPFGT